MDNTEETLDFEQKHKEDLQRLRGFRLLDDDFMSKVFEDKACAEFLLQIILQRHDLKVQSVQGQYDIKNLQGRSVRLDILAVDTNNRTYNIEIQRSDRGADAKRARYNSSLIDANITEAGDKYDALTETYVIFITENDVLKAGLPIYHVDRIIQETGEPFGDEAHIINMLVCKKTIISVSAEKSPLPIMPNYQIWELPRKKSDFLFPESKKVCQHNTNRLPTFIYFIFNDFLTQ